MGQPLVDQVLRQVVEMCQLLVTKWAAETITDGIILNELSLIMFIKKLKI